MKPIKLISAAGIGYAAHQTSPAFDNLEEDGVIILARLGRYVVGMTAVLFAFGLMTKKRMTRREAFRALFTAAAGVGSGVVAGYLMDK